MHAKTLEQLRIYAVGTQGECQRRVKTANLELKSSGNFAIYSLLALSGINASFFHDM
jgi:hypothetical protein